MARPSRSRIADSALVAVARALDRLDDPLEQLAACRDLGVALVSVERGCARDAARHHTWEEIGTALGISRQAAWKAYGRPRSSSRSR